MPRFDDTPDWKRRSTWDPVAQKLRPPERSPTRAQISYLRDLCAQRHVEYVAPGTRREAQSAIQRLVNRRKR